MMRKKYGLTLIFNVCAVMSCLGSQYDTLFGYKTDDESSVCTNRHRYFMNGKNVTNIPEAVDCCNLPFEEVKGAYEQLWFLSELSDGISPIDQSNKNSNELNLYLKKHNDALVKLLTAQENTKLRNYVDCIDKNQKYGVVSANNFNALVNLPRNVLINFGMLSAGLLQVMYKNFFLQLLTKTTRPVMISAGLVSVAAIGIVIYLAYNKRKINLAELEKVIEGKVDIDKAKNAVESCLNYCVNGETLKMMTCILLATIGHNLYDKENIVKSIGLGICFTAAMKHLLEICSIGVDVDNHNPYWTVGGLLAKVEKIKKANEQIKGEKLRNGSPSMIHFE